MKQHINFSFFCVSKSLLMLILSSFYVSKASLPQPGQNIWHVAAETATQVDTLLMCASTPLSQADVADDGILLDTTSSMYCFSQNITGSLIVSASDVTINLNSYTLFGTIDILGTVTSVSIRNGGIAPLSPINEDDANHAAIVIADDVYNTVIKDCAITCADSALPGIVGRDGIDNSGINTIIDSCIVQAGAGGQGIYVAYVSDTNNSPFNPGEIYPINIPTNSVGDAIAVNNEPGSIAITPDGTKAFVTNEFSSNVSVIDIATNAVITTIGGFNTPFNVAITPDGTTAYVANDGTAEVIPIDTSTYSVGSGIGVGNGPAGIGITPDGTTMYVANTNDSTVSVIDIGTATVTDTISGIPDASAIIITPDGTTAYVTSDNTSTIYPIAIPANTIGAGIILSSGITNFAITPDGSTIYTTAGNDVYPIAVPANTVGTAISGFLAPQQVAITPDGTTAYVVNDNGNVITIDIATNTIADSINGFIAPLAIAITPVLVNSENGGNAIVQQGDNGQITNNILTGGASGGSDAFGGSGLVVAESTVFNTIQKCSANNGGGNGFSLLTTGTANLLECLASNNIGNGFDMSESSGQGLIMACKAVANLTCGFNDNTYSSYQYLGNVSQHNDSTPANPAGDSNYCWADVAITSTFTAPTGPGAAPFYQFAPNITGTGFAPTYWNNITLQ